MPNFVGQSLTDKPGAVLQTCTGLFHIVLRPNPSKSVALSSISEHSEPKRMRFFVPQRPLRALSDRRFLPVGLFIAGLFLSVGLSRALLLQEQVQIRREAFLGAREIRNALESGVRSRILAVA